MSLSLKIAKNTVYQVLSRLISSASIFLSTILITRNLSKEVWGDFVIVTSYVGIFMLVADFGMNAIFLKKVSKEEDKEGKYFQNLLGLRMVLATFAIFFALAILVFLPHSDSVKLGIIVATTLILLQSIFNTTSAAFQEKLRYEFFAFSDILGSLVIVLLIFLAVSFKSNLQIIIGVFIIGNLVKVSLSLLFAKKVVKDFGLRFDFDLWKVLLISSFPIGLMLIFSQINSNVDKQIIALTSDQKLGLSSTIAAGIYGLSYRIFELIISVSTFLANSVYPIFLNKLKEGFSEFEIVAKKSLEVVFIFGIGVTVIGWLFAPFILNFFGDYEESLVSLRILLIGVPIFYATSLVLWINIALDKDNYLPFIYGFAAILNFSLNFYLIPRFGFNFAAWVTVITEAIILLLLFLVINYSKSFNEKV